MHIFHFIHIIEHTFSCEGGISMDYNFYPRNDVLCIDMRSFYASIEAVRLGLDRMRVMLAVVGDTSRCGSIVFVSLPTLKRKQGISIVVCVCEFQFKHVNSI